MATIRSLGLHVPTALPYLIAEGILPKDPPSSSYNWHLESHGEGAGGSAIEEEVLFTRHCVVWSRSGVVKRVYNLNAEGEAISHAFTTRFRSANTQNISSSQAFAERTDSDQDGSISTQTSMNGGMQDTSLDLTIPHRHDAVPRHDEKSQGYERALVVILSTQVHIFLVSGDMHVLPLSFEVETAVPATVGFLIQRKLSEDEVLPGVSHVQGDEKLAGQASRVHDKLDPHPILQKWLQVPKVIELMPRIFSFTEILSELGLVVCQTSKWRHSPAHRRESGTPLDQGEELLYVSQHDELRTSMDSPRDLLCIAVTMNTKTHQYTLWHVKHAGDFVGQTSRKRRKPGQDPQAEKRKSSNVFGRTSTGTPIHRGHATSRESFGALAQTFSENVPHASANEVALSQTTELAHDLGTDLTEVGVQTRSARRVSSMLARTDLSMGHDRTTFNDVAAGHPARKSLNRASKRGESVGSFGDRQSFGGRRRSSFPVNESLASNGTSFLDGHGSRFFDELDPYGDIQTAGAIGVNDSLSELPREVHFYKLKSLSKTAVRPEQARLSDERPKVFSLLSPPTSNLAEDKAQALSVCIMDRSTHELTIVNVVIQGDSGRKAPSSQSSDEPASFRQLRATDLRRGTNIVDACKVVDGTTSRILLITRTMDGMGTLHLEAPWSSPIRVELPARLTVFDPLGLASTSSDRRRDTGLNRVLEAVPGSITRLESVAAHGHFYAIDDKSKRHSIQVQLEPRDPRVRELLNIAQMVLPGRRDDGLLVAWWEVVRWLMATDQVEDVELTALVVVLFSMAVPFTEGRPGAVPRNQGRKKGGLLRSSSGAATDLSSWSLMKECELSVSGQDWTTSEPWNWTSTGVNEDVDGARRTFLSRCTTYARDFLQTPAGELAIGPEGYLPTSMNKERKLRSTSLAAILVGMHLYREEKKLHGRSGDQHDGLFDLGAILAQFGQWLRWEDWTAANGKYYSVDVADIGSWSIQSSTITALNTPGQPFEPPSIFAHIEHCVSTADNAPFPTLWDVMGRTASSVTGDRNYELVRSITPRTFALLDLLKVLRKGLSRRPAALLEAMFQCGIDSQMLETLPDGIAVCLHRAVAAQRHQSVSSLPPHLLTLIDRDDIATGPVSETRSKSTRFHLGSLHEASRDYHSIGSLAFETDNMHSWDVTSEADRQGVTRLIFREDRRFQEASKLVNQTRPPLVECNVEPEWNEAELLEAQKDLVHYVARRTLSVASGRGMMHFNARVPLLTERAPIPAFSLQCVMKPKHGNGDATPMTFSADKAAFTEDKVCWAFFHNGTSAGLMISKAAKGIDTSWILYNKPPELTNRHAGFLLALGLNGHLKNLAKWVAFKYLTPKHTMTSVGLLLGLSASYLGTMDTLITRLLSVHVTRLLPPGAAELNLSPLTQTTGIMGIGLLYCHSQHRRMSEVMLSEIENNDPEEGAAEDAILRDEGYRLAAGFALGLINLGQGKKLHSLHDMAVLERLLTIAIGSKNVNLVHVLDRATAGATIAVALIYLKTNDTTVAEKIDIPDTLHQFDYVRPDIFLLRTVARHLIMWKDIRPDFDFVVSSLPKAYQSRTSLRETRYLSTDDLPFFNIVAGICLAIGLKYAGSADESARDLLVAYLDQFIRLTRLPALNYDAKLTRNNVRNCQDVLALAVSAVMAGTGDLLVLRRLRSLHGRTDADTFYGSHLAAHMAIGALFLGGGTHTFGTSHLAVASLLCAYYPLFPTSVLDNKSHLQAFRHLWVLAAEARCLVARDVDTARPVSVQLKIQMSDGSRREVMAPSLLPALDQIKVIKTKASEYWDMTMDFTESSTVSNFRKCQSIYLRKRAAYDAPASDLFASELQALADAGPAPSVNRNAAVTPGIWKDGQNKTPFDWIFDLDTLKGLDVAERALVLPRQDASGLDSDGGKLLKGTVVDTRLELENGILDERGTEKITSRDQLWQLRLLFAWYDRWDKEKQESVDNEGGTWLRRDVIDRLRWRVWKLANAETDMEV